jgi:cell division protein FtsW
VTRFLRVPVDRFRGADRRDPDRLLLLAVFLLVGTGLVMVYAASTVMALQNHGDEFHYLKNHAFRALVGLAMMTGLAFANPLVLARHARAILLVALALLVLVLVPGIGIEARGARRWLPIGPLTLQPSEFMKLALVIYFSDFMTRREERLREFQRGLLPPLIVFAFAAFLILLEPNLGAIMLLGLIAGSLLFVGGARLHHLALVGILLALVAALSLAVQPYQLARIRNFFDGRFDLSGTEYQVFQAILGLGSGGAFGLGVGHSYQKYFFLPDAHTDFIMAIIGEELGYVGTLWILGLFALVVQRGLSIAWRSPTRFGRLLAFGLTASVFYQMMLNLAVVTHLIPTTGQPLPFVSYGGSNLLMTLSEVGILVALSRTLPVRRHEKAPARKSLIDTFRSGFTQEEFLRP